MKLKHFLDRFEGPFYLIAGLLGALIVTVNWGNIPPQYRALAVAGVIYTITNKSKIPLLRGLNVIAVVVLFILLVLQLAA